MDFSQLEPPDFKFTDKSGTPSSVVQGQDEPEDREKESRIAARRKKTQLKIEADKRAALGEKPTKEVAEDIDKEKNRPSYKQTKQSEVHILKLITDGKTLVTNVKVARESKEVIRRQEEEETRRARYERLEAEEIAATERFEEIINKWSDGRDKSVPQELQSLIAQQKKSYLDMIDEKEKLVRELQQELMAQDSQYVKSLKRHTSDIDLILERMEAQAKMLLKVHQEELVEIEKAYERERRELVESQKIEWEKIVKERAEKEKMFLENRDKRIDKQEADIQDLRVQNAEALNHVKIKLETDIQSLQQQIQQMKATFQLNAEKLEYNFQVLKKRDEENTVTISQQKRRITRLQDTLNKLQEKMNKQDKASKSDIQLLVDDFRKNTEQYRELQKKVNLFQATDSKRFRDIWKMNEGRTRELASEVLGADEIIYRQQLGLDYTSPPTIESPLNKVLPVKLADKDVSRAILYASQVVLEAAALTTSETMGASFDVGLLHYPMTVIKQVLELLCSECEFLMEDKLLRLLAPLEQEEQMMLKLDSIFKAISVENEVDIHQLVNYFMVEEGKQTSLQLEKAQSSDVKTVLIHPNAVLGRLWAFVDNRQRTGTDSPFLSKRVMGASYKDLLDGSFWSKIANITPESHEKLWDPLINGLDSYHSILQARSSLIQDVDGLRQQNTELSLLLQQYSQSHVNTKLVAPPTIQGTASMV